MVNLMVDSTTCIVESWEIRIKSEGETAEINVDEDLRSLSADIISRACFGSNFSQGRHIFSKIRSLQKLMTNQTIGVPGSRYNLTPFVTHFKHQCGNSTWFCTSCDMFIVIFIKNMI